MLCTHRLGNALVILAILSSASSQALAAGTWAEKAPMPTARYGPASGVINGKLYVASGCSYSCSSNPPTRVNVLEVYDPGTNAWSTMAPIPQSLYGSASGVIYGKLYVAGGQAYPAGNIANLQVYDPFTNTWAQNAPMPFASAAAAAGVINGNLYVVGGKDASNNITVNTLRVYDPLTDTWVIKAPEPTARVDSGAGVVNGILYVIGGDDSTNTPVGTVEAYDPSTDTWTTKTPLTDVPRVNISVGVINGIIYVAGGNDQTNVYNLVDAYDPVADTWTTQTPMPTARSLSGSGVVNGVFYVVGGGAPVSPTIPLSTNEAFSIAPVVPTTTAQCKNGGWQTFGVFKNQGDCVSYVATKGKNQ